MFSYEPQKPEGIPTINVIPYESGALLRHKVECQHVSTLCPTNFALVKSYQFTEPSVFSVLPLYCLIVLLFCTVNS